MLLLLERLVSLTLFRILLFSFFFLFNSLSRCLFGCDVQLETMRLTVQKSAEELTRSRTQLKATHTAVTTTTQTDTVRALLLLLCYKKPSCR